MSRCRHKRVVTHLRQVGSLSTAFLLEIDSMCGVKFVFLSNWSHFCTRRKEKEIPVCRRGAALDFVEFPGPPLGLGPGYCFKFVMEGLPLRRGRNNGVWS